MYQYLAYIPYAAVGYCAAKVATDVWPTLRSQLGNLSHYSSRHGLDGEAYGDRSAMSVCPPGGGAGLGPSNLTHGARRNQQVYASYVAQPAQAEYCFDEQSGQITGSGPLAGVTPPPVTVSVWDDGGVRVATVHMGDNEMTIPTCAQPSVQTGSFTSVPGEPPPPPGRRRPPTGGGGGGYEGYPENGCEPRRGYPGDSPVFSQAAPCAPMRPWGRGADTGRLSRKRNRWG